MRAIVTSLLLLVSIPATASDPSAMEQRFQALEQRLLALESILLERERTIAEQNQRIDSLEQGVIVEETVAATGLTGEERAALRSFRELEPILYRAQERAGYNYGRPDRYIQLPGTDTAIELGGHVWQDVIYDNRETDNKAGFQPSSMPTVAQRNSNESTFSAGPSKFYLKSFTPTRWGDMRTRVEWDFFQSDGNADFNLTHLWGELAGIGAGKTFSNFMDITAFPNILDFWGPNSMVFTRRSQFRYTWGLESGDLAISMEEPGTDITFADGIAADGRNELPDFVLSYHTEGDWGHFKAAGVMRQIAAEALNGSGRKDQDTGWGINLTGSLNFWERDRVVAQIAFGEGIASLMNDPCCSVVSGNDGGVDQRGDMEAIEAWGAYLYFDHWWSEKWSSSVGYSYVALDPLDMQVDEAFDNSLYTSANLIWYPFEPLKIGLEVMYGEVEDKIGRVSENTRYQASLAFKF